MNISSLLVRCEGKHLKTIYVGRMPESGQMTVASELELELHRALDQCPELDVCFASDGDGTLRSARWPDRPDLSLTRPL